MNKAHTEKNMESDNPQKNASGGSGQAGKASAPAKKKTEPLREVTNVRVTQKVGRVRLEWDLSVPHVSHIELHGKYRKDQHFWRLEGYPASVRAVELDLLPLAPIEIMIQLVFHGGTASKGVLVKTHALHKNVIEDEVEGRTIHIYLPDGYQDAKEPYPVIYMHDGQNLFCEKLAYVEHWEIDTSLERLTEAGTMSQVAVVGIFNSSRRAEEYTPFADRRFGGGKARDFSQFIVDRIIPHVESRYPVSRRREDRAVMGSSFGGILSLWMGYTYPDVFSVVGAISPSLWIADGAMLEELKSHEKKDIRIWVDQGTGEWSTFTRNAVNILIEKGYVYGKDLAYYEVKDAPHNEVAWAARVDCPFILFKGKEARQCVDMRLDVQEIHMFNVGPTEIVINPIGIFDNGMWYSLYTNATYSIRGNEGTIVQADGTVKELSPVSDPEVTATIDTTGVIQFNKDMHATVIVKYGDLERTVTVKNPHPHSKGAKPESIEPKEHNYRLPARK